MDAKKTIAFILMCIFFCVLNSVYSLLAPFFPVEAVSKGLSEFEIGVIFAIFPISNIMGSMIAPRVVSRFGTKRVVIVAGFVEALSIFCFGFLDAIDTRYGFLIAALGIRIVQGFFASFSQNAMTIDSMALTSDEYMARILSFIELSVGLGVMIGPLIGGFLYDWAGFGISFWVYSGLIVIILIILLVVYPEIEKSEKNEDTGITDIVRHKDVIVLLLTGMMSIAVISFFEPTLSLHLEKLFEFTPSQVGLTFMIPTFVYSVTTILAGIVSDKFGPRKSLILGSSLLAIGLLLAGPSPILFFLPKVFGITVVALVIVGFGLGFSVVPIIPAIMERTTSFGEGRENVVSSLFTATLSIGEITGPTIGTIISSLSNFEITTTAFSGIVLLIGIILTTTTVLIRKEYVSVNQSQNSTSLSISSSFDLSLSSSE